MEQPRPTKQKALFSPLIAATCRPCLQPAPSSLMYEPSAECPSQVAITCSNMQTAQTDCQALEAIILVFQVTTSTAFRLQTPGFNRIFWQWCAVIMLVQSMMGIEEYYSKRLAIWIEVSFQSDCKNRWIKFHTFHVNTVIRVYCSATTRSTC